MIPQRRSVPEATHTEAVREELSRIVRSSAFKNADRLARFLSFVVEEHLAGRGDLLKESLIGVEVFGREPAYDPKTDAVVRIQGRRLRTKLEAWYADDGRLSKVRILLPKGGYSPDFELVATEPENASSQQAPTARPRAGVWVAAAAVVMVGAGVAGFWATRSGPKVRSTGSRIFTAYRGYQANPAFSPDGQTLAFDWGGPDGTNSDIYLQALDADTPRRLTTSPARERLPSWLPDGKQVSFLRDAGPGRFAIVVVPVLAGAGERVVGELKGDSVTPPRINWSRDGRKIYTSEVAGEDVPSRVVEIDLETGVRRELTPPLARGSAAGTPGDDEAALSPDGQWVAFRRRTASAVGDVLAVPAHGGDARAITHDRTAITGLAWSNDSKSIIVSSRRQSSLVRLWRVPLDGTEPALLTEAALGASLPAVSPKDGLIAYASRYLDANVWRVDLSGKTAPERVIASSLLDSGPQYSPDGQRIAFRSNRTGTDEIWLAEANGMSPVKLTSFGGPVTGSPRWAPDGRGLVFDSRPDGSADVFLVGVGGGRPRKLIASASNEITPSYSADGKSIYFASDRSGTWQIWRQAADGTSDARQMTAEGGVAPQESPDGRWLYYAKLNAAGLYRRPLNGGNEELVLDALAHRMWGGWALSGETVVYAGTQGSLHSKDLAGGATRNVASLPFPPLQWDGTVAVSPDGRYALVTELEREGSEIHLRSGW